MCVGNLASPGAAAAARSRAHLRKHSKGLLVGAAAPHLSECQLCEPTASDYSKDDSGCELSQCETLPVISISFAFLNKASRSGPGGKVIARSRSNLAPTASLSSRLTVCLKRRRLPLMHSSLKKWPQRTAWGEVFRRDQSMLPIVTLATKKRDGFPQVPGSQMPKQILKMNYARPPGHPSVGPSIGPGGLMMLGLRTGVALWDRGSHRTHNPVDNARFHRARLQIGYCSTGTRKSQRIRLKEAANDTGFTRRRS